MEDMKNNGHETGGERTVKTALRFRKEMLTELRRSVMHAQRHDPSITLTSVVERGVELVLRELEKKYGEAPEVKADAKLRPGRRLGV
jgi:hypothetical protein